MGRRSVLVLLALFMGLPGCCLLDIGFSSDSRTPPVAPEALRPLPKLVVLTEDELALISSFTTPRVGPRQSLAPGELFLTVHERSVDRWWKPLVFLYEFVFVVPEVLVGLPPLVDNSTHELRLALFDPSGACVARGSSRSSRTIVGTWAWLFECGDLGFTRGHSPDMGAALDSLLRDMDERRAGR